MHSNLIKLKIKIMKYINRIGLKNKDFTIVSNNCWGGFVYQKFGLEYKTPFIGLFIFTPDYIELLKNFKELIFKELKFINFEQSKYYKEIIKNKNYHIYPIAIIGGKVEIHFLHYKSNEEAAEKWNRRVKRINFNNILFKLSEDNLCTDKEIKEFNNLNVKHKICFTSKVYNQFKDTICIEECVNSGVVKGEHQYYEKYIDIKSILNNLYNN